MKLDAIYEAFKASTGICTDTRKVKTGNIFFALKGPNFNANTFTKQALENGADFAVIDEQEHHIEGKTFVVDDALTTLQDLARLYREDLKIPLIGLTGSNGKTTTKELIREVLKQKFKTLATQGNLNNHIGVPLTILSITKDIEIAVVEMGANHVGEIAFLCEICRPTHGLITNIGKAHTGEFGGFDNVIRAKSELYHFLIKSEGKVFVNSNQEILRNMAKRIKEPLFYPNKEDYMHCELLSSNPYVTYQDENGEEVETHLTGDYNFDNITSALCVGKYFAIPGGKMNQAIAHYKPDNNRSQILQHGNNTIILDAYNANPSSMEAALDNLNIYTSPRKAVMLGDMLELGEDTQSEHEAIGEKLNHMDLESVLLVGTHMAFAHSKCPRSKYFESKDTLISYLKQNNFENTTILIKGSRGLSLETLLDYL